MTITARTSTAPSSTALRPLQPEAGTNLPHWPFTAMLSLYPLWWVLGFGSIAWIPLAGCMAVLMYRRGRIRVPRGLSIWFLFLLFMCVSVINIEAPSRLIGFSYRALLYATVTVVFIYIYNAREELTARRVLGATTAFLAFAVVGGFAGILFPTFSFSTPLGYIIPKSLQANELVGEMVERRLTQHNPDSWFAMDPRPSAPFLYTNQWGNVYSLALPMALSYLARFRRHERDARFWLTVLLIPVSLVPALLTLNRGMFIGLAVAGLYMFFRYVLTRNRVGALSIGLVGVVALVAAQALGVGDRLLERVETSSSTEDRATLYQETWARTLGSPIFGYGAPRPSVYEGMPSAGTQGHIWTVMFSFGLPALAFFMLALAWLAYRTHRVQSTPDLLLHTVQLVILVEVLYYGVLPNGLVLSFAAAALLMRGAAPQRAVDGTSLGLPAVATPVPRSSLRRTGERGSV